MSDEATARGDPTGHDPAPVTAADAATDGATAGATASATDSRGHFAESACLDCGAELLGPHCHVCGQAAHPPHTARAWLRDTVFARALDPRGKFWGSLRALVLRPGELTRRYCAGQRTRFVGPLGLFLLGYLLLFAAVTLTGADRGSLGQPFPALSIARAELDLHDVVDEAERGEPGTATNTPDAASEKKRLDLIERGRSALFFLDQARTAWEPEGDRLDVEAQMERAGLSDLRRQLTDPALFLSQMETAAYRFGWLLIVLLTPFVGLMFVHRRRRHTLYDHAAFVTYSLAFASLLAAALVLLATAGVGVWLTVPLFVAGWLVHGALHLRGAYALGAWGTAWRTAALAVLVPLALALVTALLAVLGLA